MGRWRFFAGRWSPDMQETGSLLCVRRKEARLFVGAVACCQASLALCLPADCRQCTVVDWTRLGSQHGPLCTVKDVLSSEVTDKRKSTYDVATIEKEKAECRGAFAVHWPVSFPTSCTLVCLLPSFFSSPHGSESAARSIPPLLGFPRST